MQKITPFLWFDNNAEEAMKFMSLSLRIPGSGVLLDIVKVVQGRQVR